MATNTMDRADVEPARTRWLDVLANAPALYPLLVCASLYGFWCMAWWQLGHPPRPSLDDPKDVAGTAWLHELSELLLAGVLPGFLALVVVQVARVLRDHRQPWRAVGRAAVGCAGWVGAVGLLATDPGNVLLWFFD
jgi:hypothetical protein